MEVKKVLLIEDSPLIRLQVKQLLEKENFAVLELENAKELFTAHWRYREVSVILLDVNLPGMDGLAVLKEMNENKQVTWPPVIMLSSCSNKDTIRTSLLLGAKDYILKPFSIEMFLQKIEHMFSLSKPMKHRQRYCELVQVLKEAYQSYIASNCNNLPGDTITVLVNECYEIVKHDETLILFQEGYNMEDYSFRHTINVSILSGIIGKWMGLKEQDIQELILTGLLHDIGKSRIPRDLLTKSGELSTTEINILKTHPMESYKLIRSEEFSVNVVLGVIQHHERMDGSGYPNGLLGKDICLGARIVAIADVYDAMTSNKSYRKAESPFMVIEELFREMFNKLDPHICTVFLKHTKERLVGRSVLLSDGSKAKVDHVEGEGFGNPVLKHDGKVVELTNSLNVVDFVRCERGRS